MVSVKSRGFGLAGFGPGPTSSIATAFMLPIVVDAMKDGCWQRFESIEIRCIFITMNSFLDFVHTHCVYQFLLCDVVDNILRAP